MSDLTEVLARGRAAAEARMLSRVTVRRKTGAKAQDSTGRKAPEWATVHTDLPFRLAGAYHGDSPTQHVDAGVVKYDRAVRTGNFPASLTDLRDDDYVEITAGDTAGLVVRVVEATWQDQSTARRVPVVEVRRPTEWDD